MSKPVGFLRSSAVAAFFVFSLLFFAPSYANYFVSDDYEFLARTGLSEASQYFTHSWGYGNEYRPVLAYSYALNAEAGTFSPIGYHVVNTALHTLVALLVGSMAYYCGLPPAWSALAAIIFLLNPVAHESFLWIAGRPVVLSTAFLFASLLSFVKVAKPELPRRRLYVGVLYSTFIAGLLTYEGAVVLPLLAAAILALLPRYRSRRALVHLAGLCALTVAYLIFWNWFFSFRITRFPVETTLAGAAASLGTAVTYAFHGSRRLELAPVYVALLISLAARRETRRFAGFCAAWFVVAYLPFLLVKGFAARFAYVASTAVAIALSASARQIWDRSRGAASVIITALLVFYSIGMQHRIAMWRTAGEIARTVAQDVKTARPTIPPGSTIVLLGVPDMYKHALVFLTGLERAIELQYPRSSDISVRRSLEPNVSRAIVFEYHEGRMRELP